MAARTTIRRASTGPVSRGPSGQRCGVRERGDLMAKWTANDSPDLSGKTAVVTGANSGLGYETALELARHGAHVVMACRDEGRGTEALQRLRANAPGASADLSLLDLADLASV